VRAAVLQDVPRIAELIAGNARKGGLLPRSADNIRASIRNFLVAEMTDDGRRMTDDTCPAADGELLPTTNPGSSIVVGCGSLVPMNTTLVELRSLAVDETVRGGGIGLKITQALIEEARARKFGTLFALTRAVHFFEKCGLTVTPKEHFPEKVWRDCVACPLLAQCDEVAMTLLLDDEGRKTKDEGQFVDVQNQPASSVVRHSSDSEQAIPRETVRAMLDSEGARSVNMMREPVNKVVLAYSGGLDTACAVPWLRENYGCEVVCFVADVGQGGDFDAIRKRAIDSGASDCIVEDLREEFANEYLFPMIQSGAIYENKYMLGASIVRPLMARHQVDIASRLAADAVAHAATGKGNDQVRFELCYMALNPRLKVIAPWREWHIRGRDDALAYACAHGIPVSQTMERIYSGDRSMWHKSTEGGGLEDPWAEPDPALYAITVAPEDAPDEPEYVEVEFVCGIPKKVNGKSMGGAELVETLNALGARHGVGRVDLVENRLVGMKSRGVYEQPGGTILRAAHQGIQELTLDRETLHYKQVVALKYGELIYNGLWFTPLRDALQAFITVTQRDVTGAARVKLYKGSATLVGRQATYSLYREDLATFMREDVYNQKDAEGFIRLYGLPMHVKAQVDLNRAAHVVPVELRNVQRRD
jgi:argininosuccinate synthase